METQTLAQKFLAASEFKAICKIDYGKLDDIITEFFTGSPLGKNTYKSVAYEEWGNYESHEFSVEKEDIEDYDMETIELAKEGKWKRYSLDTYLTHLCNEGIIPECELIVSVSW